MVVLPACTVNLEISVFLVNKFVIFSEFRVWDVEAISNVNVVDRVAYGFVVVGKSECAVA